MNGTIAPCKGCPDRVLGCHDHCPKYKEFKKEIERINKKRRLEEMKEEYSKTRRRRR